MHVIPVDSTCIDSVWYEIGIGTSGVVGRAGCVNTALGDNGGLFTEVPDPLL